MVRKTAVSFFFFLLFGLRIAGADAPSAVRADYDSGRQELNVSVGHPVVNPLEHFVEKIVILKNGAEVDARNFEFQTSHRNQTMKPFKMALQPGDDIKVVATCNKSESSEGLLKIK